MSSDQERTLSLPSSSYLQVPVLPVVQRSRAYSSCTQRDVIARGNDATGQLARRLAAGGSNWSVCSATFDKTLSAGNRIRSIFNLSSKKVNHIRQQPIEVIEMIEITIYIKQNRLVPGKIGYVRS